MPRTSKPTSRRSPAADGPQAKGEPASRRESASGRPLARYNAKRDFTRTPEPAGEVPASAAAQALGFVIQKHWASRLHYDFRLELDGVMLSWAVPKGPSFDPAIKQMAIHVEDHPISYNTFEGRIPKGQYGSGTVIVWDRGTWEPVGDPREGMARGKLIFRLHGQKLAGLWELVRISKPGELKQDQWLLLKKRGDAWARPTSDYDVITALPDSVVAHPLGLVEEREARGQSARPGPPATDLSQAQRAHLPKQLKPQLATLASQVPAGGDWVYEIKFDGYRMLARIEGDDVRLLSRNGQEWTAKLKSLANELRGFGLDAAWLDGEIVVLDERGLPDFNRLQNAMDATRSAGVVYFVFDVPFLGDQDLRQVPLASRRQVLAQLFAAVPATDQVRMSQAFEVPPGEVLAAACRLGLEGVMAKRADATYVSARTESWLKLKCQQRQEFVVVGFTERESGRSEVGALLLGYHDEGVLRYGGSVGTGWNAATGQALRMSLQPLLTDRPCVDPAGVKPGRWSRRKAAETKWVKPDLVVEVAFSEWTPDGHIRHATFRGVRGDKPAGVVGREAATGRGGAPAPPAAGAPAGVKVSNPQRVIDPSTGLKKLDLVRYYESVAEWILPHLRERPVSLVRAPQGVMAQQFFQKHPESKMPGLRELDPTLWPGHAALLVVDSVEALLAATQMNVVEFHTWNSTARHIDLPDRVIFDLDPGEGVAWAQLQEAALLVRALLHELGLQAWLKTSGGKGLHVVVPLAPKLDYETVKAFSKAAVEHLAKTIPQRFVAKSGAANRVGKIFVDYLRNGHAQTTAAAFSARARPGLGVSMPIAWEQLGTTKSGAQWTIATAREYLSFQAADPWQDYWTSGQRLSKALRILKRA